MATRTGRLVVDMKTGNVVEELKEDQMMVALYDSACGTDVQALAFQRVLRSDFTVKKINMLFGCNAALLKDPFGNVLWPKDWMVQVLPPKGKDNWYYVIHERLEPPPQDDLADPMYSGETILILSHVPLACEARDLKAWLLFGIAQDYAPLKDVRAEIDVTRRKKMLVTQKIAALPSMEVDGDAAQQAELRKKLADAISGHAARFDKQLDALAKKHKRVERLLMTEPMELTQLPVDKQQQPPGGRSSMSGGGGDPEHVETRTWVVAFTSPRGQELASVAMEKCDWNYVCLVQTRPQPRAFLEDDQVEHDVVSAADLAMEVNMRTVRLRRLKHGEGECMVPASHGDKDKTPLSPWDDAFHISSIGAMYSGEWRLGGKHGRGVEYTNAGFYDGEFAQNARSGVGKLVLGAGTTCEGTFERPSRTYEYAKKCKGRVYPQSLLNGDAFRDGVAHGAVMHITFPDGAHYEGEMTGGRVTGFGRYTSSSGVVDEGTFVDGLLYGEQCSRRFPDGSLQEGEFAHGQLHGRGRQRERNGDSYDGFFELGVRHGRATAYFDNKHAKHVGFWRENAMNGRGDFYYRHREPSDQSRAPRKEYQRTPDDTTAPASPEETSERWDYWYEGSFLQNESVARHRHVDLESRFPEHLPFTTNGKSSEKMPFLTDALPPALRKHEARARKNAQRRLAREKQFLAAKEVANLSLYYSLLDDFYDTWAARKRSARHDRELSAEERAEAERERAAMREFEANRVKRRKEKYDLSPRQRELRRFDEYLERITLTEHERLERAMASELTDTTAALRQAQSEGW